jgi:hypothetical protein
MRAVWGFSIVSVLAISGRSAVEGIYHGKVSDPGSYCRAQLERSQLHEAR